MKPRDHTVDCLYAALIVLVVAGHIPDSRGFSGLFDLFPPYSFHVAGFAFLSGYLYNTRHDADLRGYVVGRVRRLLLPAVAMYLAYGIIASFMQEALGFGYNVDLSVKSLLWGMLGDGRQFRLNYPMWFIAPFFAAQILFALVRRVASVAAGAGSDRHGQRRTAFVDVATLVACLCGGVAAVVLGGPEGIYGGALSFVARSLFLCSWVAIGRAYTVFLAKRDTLANGPYFLAVIALQLVVTYACGGEIAYTLSWSRYPHGIVLTYAATALGIAFLLRVCRILAPVIGESRVVGLVGRNTFSIMNHHIMGFWVLNALLYGAHVVTGLFGGFSLYEWQHHSNYVYRPAGMPQFAMVYLVVGIAFALLVHEAWTRVRRAAAGLGRR